MSIQEPSVEQKNKTYSLHYRSLPQKKEGSNAVKKAKKKTKTHKTPQKKPRNKLLNLYYGKKSAWELMLLYRTSTSVSSQWWYSASQMMQEKIYVPRSPYIIWVLPIVKTACMIIHLARPEGGNVFPPRPSLQTPRQIMQHISHRSVIQRRLQRAIGKWPAPSQPPTALGQHFISWVPVSVSIWSSPVLPAKKLG